MPEPLGHYDDEIPHPTPEIMVTEFYGTVESLGKHIADPLIVHVDHGVCYEFVSFTITQHRSPGYEAYGWAIAWRRTRR